MVTTSGGPHGQPDHLVLPRRSLAQVPLWIPDGDEGGQTLVLETEFVADRLLHPFSARDAHAPEAFGSKRRLQEHDRAPRANEVHFVVVRGLGVG